MSDLGKKLKTKSRLTTEDYSRLQLLIPKFTQGRYQQYYNIPSDTGLVLLMKENFLVASRDISVGQIITFVPITKKLNISYPWILVTGKLLNKIQHL